MGKTQSQTLNITIKKEEEEDCKSSLCLYSANNTTTNKITKRSPSRPLSAQQIKVEEDTDTKSLLKSESSSSRPRVLQEQINQLIHYIVNDNMSIRVASRKAKMSECGGYNYYNIYKNDPEKRIPLPRDQTSKNYTQEQIGNLIRYVNDDKMAVTEASAKVNMLYTSGWYYYNRYLNDPNHNIPIVRPYQTYTQDQKSEFIDYVINDKMNITAASKKAKINTDTARGYYHNYFNVQNPDIPTPSHIVTPKYYTQDQKNQLISYIVDDRMTIMAASRKANMDQSTAAKYYRQYLIANNMKIPVPGNTKSYSQDKKNEFIGYIVDDKMNITAASKKANIPLTTGRRYYHRYLHARKRDEPNRRL